MQTDVIIIGGGVIGCAAAYELSRYQVKVLLLEAENDVACGATRANSAIVHAGYDPTPGSFMARANVRGNRLMPGLCERLDVPFRRCGSLVLAFDETELATLEKLHVQGLENGVPELRLIGPEELRALEPGVSPDAVGALLAESCGIVDPWGLAMAMAETAVRNGVEVIRRARVTGITADDEGFIITTDSPFGSAGRREFRCRYILNAAGIYADRIQALLGGDEFEIRPDKGAYFLLDHSQGNLVSRVIFQCPTPKGKGVLVAPTVHGNLIVGPDTGGVADREDVSAQAANLTFVRESALRSVAGINFRESIRNFAGLRARAVKNGVPVHDFILGPSAAHPRFINLAGIQSPGLTAAPAIAEMAVEFLRGAGLNAPEKAEFIGTRRQTKFSNLSRREQQALVAQNPLYGRVVCRCETITEGEIMDTLHSPLPPYTMDGVKRRCGAGMGRCQGGFCGPRVHELLAAFHGLPMEEIEKERPGSWIVLGRTKEGGGL